MLIGHFYANKEINMLFVISKIECQRFGERKKKFDKFTLIESRVSSETTGWQFMRSMPKAPVGAKVWQFMRSMNEKRNAKLTKAKCTHKLACEREAGKLCEA